METLPDEIVALILRGLNLKSVNNFRSTNSEYQNIVDKENMITEKKIEEFPNIFDPKGMIELTNETWKNLNFEFDYSINFYKKDNKLIFDIKNLYDNNIKYLLEFEVGDVPHKIYFNRLGNDFFIIILVYYNKIQHISVGDNIEDIKEFIITDDIIKIYQNSYHDYIYLISKNYVKIIELPNSIFEFKLIYRGKNYIIIENDVDIMIQGKENIKYLIIFMNKYFVDIFAYVYKGGDHLISETISDIFDDEIVDKIDAFMNKSFDINGQQKNDEFFEELDRNYRPKYYTNQLK
jgi:hypothetical protein